MFSTVLELTTTRFMTKRRSKFACGKISALPRSRCCLLFSLHARVYLTFPLTKTYGYGRLCDRCNYMETAFFAIVCDCLRSAIVCDRLRLYGNQPLDRTWFFLLRSSAITTAGSQTIAEVFPYDRRRSQTLLRSAICDPRSYGNQPLETKNLVYRSVSFDMSDLPVICISTIGLITVFDAILTSRQTRLK